MEIGPVSNRITGQRSEKVETAPQEAVRNSESLKSPRGDRAEISDEGRARLLELADAERLRELEGPEPVSADNLNNEERLEIIRRRVASGYYDDPQVVRKIADRLIDGLGK